MASVSIVILNYNGKHHLEKFLPTVILYSHGCDIVVADNNSTDESKAYLTRTFPTVRILSFKKNYGFCKGYNKALFQLDTEYFVLLNSDIEVTKNWITPVINLFEKNKDIAAIQPKLLDYNARDTFEYAGGAGGYIDKYGYPFCRGRIFSTIEKDEGQYDDVREIFWASGACLFIKRSLFTKYGGFDPEFFAHMEEIDLCWRLKQDKYKICYCPESTVYHVGGGTLGYANPQKTYLNFRNSMMVLIKNLPAKELVPKLFFRWFMDYVAAIKFLLTGNYKDTIMVIKSHLYIWKNLKIILVKRKKGIKSISGTPGVYNNFLLFSYHIAGVRKFKDLKF